MKTFLEVSDWCIGAAEEFGDPAVPVCQLFARYLDPAAVAGYRGEELVFGGASPALWLAPEVCIPLAIAKRGPCCVNAMGELTAFEATLVVPGVWSLSPSLNITGVIHAFVVLYDVPSPAPWERLIVAA